MGDAGRQPRVNGGSEAGERALAYLREISPDMRAAAILGGDGSVLAASGDADRWRSAAARLLDSADAAGAQVAQQVHVATEEGEVFAVRAEGLTAIAVTERFALASLMAWDMRAALRDVGAEAAAAGTG